MSKVFGVISEERRYQSVQQLTGRFQKKTHSVGEELAIMKVYLDEALIAFAKNHGDAKALHAIRKVVALGVRCMQNHGALPREEKTIVFHAKKMTANLYQDEKRIAKVQFQAIKNVLSEAARSKLTDKDLEKTVEIIRKIVVKKEDE